MRARAAHTVNRWIGGEKQADRRCSECRREMREAGVDADDDIGARKRCRGLRQRESGRNDRAIVAVGKPPAARLFVVRAPWQHGCIACAAHMHDQRPPAFLGPQFFRATCRVQQNGVRPLGNCRRGRRWNDMPARRAVQRITERGCGQVTAALNEVQVAGHAMMYIMRERGDWLADGSPIETVAASVCRARDQRAFELFLQVEDCGVSVRLDLAAKHSDFPPRRSRQRRLAPAAQREGNDPTYVRAHLEQWHKTTLGDPVDRKLRLVAPNVGRDRKCVNDIAERRRSNDEDGAH